MICPVCKSDTVVVEYNDIELDYCTGCHGVWFDSGELELLLRSIRPASTDLLPSEILISPEARASETKRKCPICGQKMKETSIGKEPDILVDVCQQGHGLWFDGGEVAQLLRQLPEKPSAKGDSQQQLIGFLGEVFKAGE